MADEAVKLEKTVIQNASEYADWGNGNYGKITYMNIPKSEMTRMKSTVATFVTTPIKGTMKIHAAVLCPTSGDIWTRETSCYCGGCMPTTDCKYDSICDGWTCHKASGGKAGRTTKNAIVKDSKPKDTNSTMKRARVSAFELMAQALDDC